MEKLKILILEDFESDVELIKREILFNLDYKIDFKWVISKENFVKALNEFQPDIILSDYNLPQFNGLEALKITASVNDLIPFIIVTGTLDEESAAGCIKEGAWDYIVKERLSKLSGAIKNALRLKSEKIKARNAQIALKESENWYRSIFENTGTASIIVDKNGYITQVNSKFEELSGLNKEETEGKIKWMDFVPEPDKSRMIEYQKRRQVKDLNVPRQYEFTFISPKGIARDILLDVDLIPGTTNTIASLLDISERKKMELEIKASKEKFQNLVENINDVLFETDTNGIITYISPIIEKITGYPASCYIEQSFFNFFYKEDIKFIKEKFGNLIYKNIVRPDELKIKTKNSKLVWLRISANNIYENGKVIGIRGLAVDITLQKQIEQELIKAKEKAEESDRLKSAFLASMSHELRTPLNAVIGFSELISEKLELDEITEMGKLINNSGNHLLNIIEDIFEISMLQTNKHKIIKEKFSVSDLLSSLQNYIDIDLKKAGKEHLNVIFNNPFPSILMHTDKTKLNQLLINLLNNSIKFTSEGSVKLSYKIKGDEIIFCVKDTGIGIPENKLDIIFDQFRQVDDSLTREHGGVGLGLAICKEISTLLNGKLWVESEEGKGSSFYLSLKDAIIEDQNNNVSKQKNLQMDFSDKTILVVEDVESNYLLLKNYISILKASVLWVKNGEESVKLCKENQDIDLVLMDIRMPGMDGFEATKLILDSKPEIKIIAQTAYALKDDKNKALEAGCIDYISKPIRILDFNNLLKKHLHNSN